MAVCSSTRNPHRYSLEIENIASEPDTGFELLKRRVGFDQTKPSQPLPDRCLELCGWRFVLTDARHLRTSP